MTVGEWNTAWGERAARFGAAARWAAAAWLVCTGLAAWCQPAELSVQDLLGVPDYDEVQLSPDGRFLAVLVPVQGRVNLAVIDIDARKPLSRIAIPGADIRSLRWLGNERLLFSMARYGEVGAAANNTGGLYLVGRDGRQQRQLFPTAREFFATGGRRYVYYRPVGDVPGSDEDVIVESNDVDRDSTDLYRFNVLSGQRRLLTSQRPPRTLDWILDRALVPRVVVATVADSTQTIVHYREQASAPWRELWRNNPLTGAMTVPLHFDADNRRLLIASNEGRDTMALYLYDPQTGQRGEPLLQDPRFDIGADAMGNRLDSLLFDAPGRDVVGFRVDAERPRYHWTEPGLRRLHELVDQALPQTVNLVQRAREGSRALVLSYSDRLPLQWSLLDEATGRLQPLFTSRPWLDRKPLVPMKPFFFATRDGLELPAYLFEPPHRTAGQPLPTVVLLHGGPWARPDTWGEHSSGVVQAQLLASRGYAVVLPTFRGTTGLGRKVFEAARRQFGLRMQEDVEDATDWAVREGIADPRRICLMGASYGGYAALMGTVKTPDKYRCAVAGMPVTDVEMLIASGWSSISRNERPRRFWVDMVGDPATQSEALRAVSPARQAHRIRAAVMLYGGADDSRTPLEHMESMRSALRAQGREPVWMVRHGEGHGLAGTDSQRALYRQLFDFLAQQLRAPEPQAAGAAAPPGQRP